MEVVLLIVALVLAAFFLMLNGSTNTSLTETREGRELASLRRREISSELGLIDVSGTGNVIGYHPKNRAFAFVNSDGTGKWIPLDAVAGIELTPFFSTFEEGSSVTKTRRGGQLIGAGIGAAIAGPAGLIVGGLSAGKAATYSSSSTERLDYMEMKVRTISVDEPLVKILIANSSCLDPATNKFEGGLEGLERLAARLATEIERRPGDWEKPQFQSFETITMREMTLPKVSGWSGTFGS